MSQRLKEAWPSTLMMFKVGLKMDANYPVAYAKYKSMGLIHIYIQS